MLSKVEPEWGESDESTLPARKQQWLNDFQGNTEFYTSAHGCQNVINSSQANYLQAYYGNSLSRLRAVKRKYDPDNLFHYPQSTPE